MVGKSKGPLDQRLKDLEKEFTRVRGDIKSLSRAVQDPDLTDLPLIQYGRSQTAEEEPAPSEKPKIQPAPPADLSRPPPEPEPVTRLKPKPKPELKPARVPEPEPPASPKKPSSNHLIRKQMLEGGTDSTSARPSRAPGSLSQDFRFASYLSSVSMSSPGPTRRERSVQRNKAIVMVLVVVLALYVVIQLLGD